MRASPMLRQVHRNALEELMNRITMRLMERQYLAALWDRKCIHTTQCCPLSSSPPREERTLSFHLFREG